MKQRRMASSGPQNGLYGYQKKKKKEQSVGERTCGRGGIDKEGGPKMRIGKMRNRRVSRKNT